MLYILVNELIVMFPSELNLKHTLTYTVMISQSKILVIWDILFNIPILWALGQDCYFDTLTNINENFFNQVGLANSPDS